MNKPNLINIAETKIKAEVEKPYYLSIWLIENCKIDLRYNQEEFLIALNNELEVKKDYMILPKKSGLFKIQVIATPLDNQEPTPPEAQEKVPYEVELESLQTLQDLSDSLNVTNVSNLTYKLSKEDAFNVVSMSLRTSLNDSGYPFSKTEDLYFTTFNFDLGTLPSEAELQNLKVYFVNPDGKEVRNAIALEVLESKNGIATQELIVNGTEGGTSITPPPSINDSAAIIEPPTSIPSTPLIPAETKSQFITIEVEVELELPLGMYEFFKTFPELKPTASTKEGLERWQNVMKKVKCIYQEYSQPENICTAYPLFALTAHYGIIEGLGKEVGIVRADGVVASSSVGDVSVSFQTQPYGNNEFTYFLGLTKYGLEFLAWLNRRSGLYYAN